MRKAVFLIVLILALLACAQAQDIRIVVGSDLHYLSPELIEDEALLRRVVYASDSKLTHYTSVISEAFTEEVAALHPDAVILSGDLTFSGAFESHAGLIVLLSSLQEDGIPVLALSGNHDAPGTAYRFVNGITEEIAGMRDEDFHAAYYAFGPESALSRDTVSFSYTYALNEKLWILLIDVNTNGSPNRVREETLAWVESQLAAARENGAAVISVTHQTLLNQDPLYGHLYQFENAKELLALLQEYGVRLHLSGHMHMQHITASGELHEIASSALSVWPCQYGIITIREDGSVHYEAQPVDVGSWAHVHGVTNEELLDFAKYSENSFNSDSRRASTISVYGSGANKAEQRLMLEYKVIFNAEMFSGRHTDHTQDTEAISLWQRYFPDSFTTRYMEAELSRPVVDMTKLDLPSLY